MIEASSEIISEGGELPMLELIYFNGTTWNNMDEHIWGTDWHPVLTTCQLGEYPNTRKGHQMLCGYGNGNCWDGTTCIADNN
jgi:hypothetical protein